MKFSLSWIFDHIDADWRTIDVPHLVAEFNKKTAEIERYYSLSLPLDQFALASVQEIGAEEIRVYVQDLSASFTLPFRPDATKGASFLIKEEKKGTWAWVTAIDFKAEKDMLLPALGMTGDWRKEIEKEDWIIDVDNKSINHRPDLWGHRGMAREISVLLNLSLKPLEQLITPLNLLEYEKRAVPTERQPFTITIENTALCKRFAGIYFSDLHTQPSLVWMASRLARVGSRAINATVDLTNYVMLDVSQPLHAFDAEKIPTKAITICLAKPGEKLLLIDEEQITLTSHDLVISDGKHPLALAGVMGGRSSAINSDTKTVFLEAACFDAATIRKSALRIKKRTEASVRFEKSLDPNQNTQAIARFVKIAIDNALINKSVVGMAVSIGPSAKELSLKITHAYIEERLGVPVQESFVVSILQKIGFSVQTNHGNYTVLVPTYRSTKDVTIKDDIVEEIGRIYGYGEIPEIFPTRQMRPFDLQEVMRTRTVKNIMAYGLALQEVYQYAFFDEQFLKELGWQPKETASVQNPVSQNWQRLVTTLIPGLLKVVVEHAVEHTQLRFFEWGRIWRPEQSGIEERKRLAGIIYHKKEPVDFYRAKQELATLFAALDIAIEWKQAEYLPEPWFAPYQTAQLLHEGAVIGHAGKLMLMPGLSEGDGFIFELEADFLLSYKPALKKFVALSKYPDVQRDVSLLVPLPVTVDALIARIKQADGRIVSVDLVDLFEKEEWHDKKSVTLRFVINDREKTLTKEEVDAIEERIVADLARLGADIR